VHEALSSYVSSFSCYMCPAEQPAPRFSCETCVFTTSFTTRITRGRTHPAEQPAPRFYCDYMCPHSITTRVLTLLLYIYIYVLQDGLWPTAQHMCPHLILLLHVSSHYCYICVLQDGLWPTAQPARSVSLGTAFSKEKKKNLYTGLTQALARARCRAGDEAHDLSFITTLD
jgi:hypothetical protein